jgi:uncharacterized coiled-coil DUF342 family protein
LIIACRQSFFFDTSTRKTPTKKLRKKSKKTRVSKEQKAVRKEAERIFNLFRGGEKLTTDDILLLQRSKLI